MIILFPDVTVVDVEEILMHKTCFILSTEFSLKSDHPQHVDGVAIIRITSMEDNHLETEVHLK